MTYTGKCQTRASLAWLAVRYRSKYALGSSALLESVTFSRISKDAAQARAESMIEE
jgi:hypothetical protein